MVLFPFHLYLFPISIPFHLIFFNELLLFSRAKHGN